MSKLSVRQPEESDKAPRGSLRRSRDRPIESQADPWSRDAAFLFTNLGKQLKSARMKTRKSRKYRLRQQVPPKYRPLVASSDGECQLN